MLAKGYLATTSMYMNYSHKDQHIEGYLEAVDETFRMLAKAIQNEEVSQLLQGPVRHSGFERLT